MYPKSTECACEMAKQQHCMKGQAALEGWGENMMKISHPPKIENNFLRLKFQMYFLSAIMR